MTTIIYQGSYRSTKELYPPILGSTNDGTDDGTPIKHCDCVPDKDRQCGMQPATPLPGLGSLNPGAVLLPNLATGKISARQCPLSPRLMTEMK